MAYDLQVLGQSALYFGIFILGFVVAVPLGVTVIEFSNQCILYTDWTWVNSTHAKFVLTNHNVCNFPVYLAVFTCILYALGMGIYHAYAALSTKDPNVGFQMWVMPFLLANTLIAILMFIACCVMSVGMKELCDDIMQGKKMGVKISSCADAVNYNWNYAKTDYKYSHFYSFPKTSESAGWITFFLWVAQVVLCIVRFVRNRRLRSKDMAPEPQTGTPQSPGTPSDLENFAAVQPTA